MRSPAVDLVVERLVVEGFDLIPEQGATLAVLVEDELRRLAAAGGLSGGRRVALADALPAALALPPDLPAMARALAQHIVDEIAAARGDHG